MFWPEASEFEKAINRDRCITLYAHLRGCYHELIKAYSRFKASDGKYKYVDPIAKAKWDRENIPDIEYLCGPWYTQGVKCGIIPHPIQVALNLKYGRDIKKAMNEIGMSGMIPSVRARCKKLGIILEGDTNAKSLHP